MCEFCDLPQNRGKRLQVHRQHADFAGFFSAALIDAAVQQAKAERAAKKCSKPGDNNAATAPDDGVGLGDVDDDGT